MLKIFTITGFLFSNPSSLLQLVTMLKQLVFIWLTSVCCHSGAMAQLRMHKALVFPQAYPFAIYNSGKMFLNNSPKWSEVANSRLCSARKPVTLTSAALTSLSRSETTAMKCCVKGLWALLLFNKSMFSKGAVSVQISFSLMFNWNGFITD